MYTEDDEKVKLKKNDSNIEYSDFYTSFNEIENEKEETKNNKVKNKEKSKNKDEEEKDYTLTYNENYEQDNNIDKKKKIIKIAIIIVLAIFLLVIIILLFKGCSKKVSGDIVLSKESISLNLGEKDYISYKVVDTESSVTSSFESSNSSVASVSSSGEVMAMGVGDATITIHYTIDGVTREKKCNIKVNENKNINTNIELNLKFESGQNDTWTNKDIVIITDAKSVFGISSIKYALNCEGSCNYTDVTNNKITIGNNGTTKVKVIAKDKKNQEITKEVIAKVDKEAPTVTLNSGKNITSNKDVTVCATCSDTLSGCKQKSVCKKYTSSKSNQVITVYDAAGNSKNSESFNVTINKLKAPCTLKVSSDGVVSATINESATYYGFNSSYTGTNELSKKISINASRNGESGAKVIYYYVKNKNGTGGKCFITIIKKCSCTDKNSTDANCPVTCTFTSQ